MSDLQQAIITGLIGSPLVFGLYNYGKNTILAQTIHRGWQAVFLSNGQVYFGKVKSLSADSLRLKDVYYLKEQNNTEGLVFKLGEEKIHAPKDVMTISRASIIFIEGLQPDSEVIQSIDFHKLGKRVEKISLADLPDIRPDHR